MHRSYQPTKPSTNKVLAKRWDDQKFTSHRDRVRGAKPMVDTRPPKVHSHLAVKMKKLQLEEERSSVIDRDNRMLLERMSTIMHTRGRVDDRNEYEHKSLNRLKRQRELMTIMEENQKIIRRLKDRTLKPNYDNGKMAVDWERKRQYASTIATYPPDWYQQMEQSGQVRRRNGPLSQTTPATTQKRQTLPPIGKHHTAQGAMAAGGTSDSDEEDAEDGRRREDSPIGFLRTDGGQPVTSTPLAGNSTAEEEDDREASTAGTERSKASSNAASNAASNASSKAASNTASNTASKAASNAASNVPTPSAESRKEESRAQDVPSAQPPREPSRPTSAASQASKSSSHSKASSASSASKASVASKESASAKSASKTSAKPSTATSSKSPSRASSQSSLVSDQA